MAEHDPSPAAPEALAAESLGGEALAAESLVPESLRGEGRGDEPHARDAERSSNSGLIRVGVRSVLSDPSGDDAPASGRRTVDGYTRAAAPLTRKDYAPGRILAGRYRVERLLGEGAMGVVVAARHLELDELVAIKFIRPEMHKDAEVSSRFAREAKASARIKSEHVVKLLDVGVAIPIGPYLVMEYLEGSNLCEVLTNECRIAVPRAAELVMQACEALAAAHASGITHRDIKPENLFLIQRGELEVVKLLDFGISKGALHGRVFGGELSVDNSSCLLGTPLYMSPEQIQNTEQVDARTDIWSLGVVLYELVTGTPAFAADTVPEVCSRVLADTPAPLAQHCPLAPAGLQEVIDRCLQKDAARRFGDIAQLARALVPFAPSRAGLYAEFSTSLLRKPGGIVAASCAAQPLQRASQAPAPAATFTAAAAALPALAELPKGPAVGVVTSSRAWHASARTRRPLFYALSLLGLCSLGLVALLGYAALFAPQRSPAAGGVAPGAIAASIDAIAALPAAAVAAPSAAAPSAATPSGGGVDTGAAPRAHGKVRSATPGVAAQESVVAPRFAKEKAPPSAKEKAPPSAKEKAPPSAKEKAPPSAKEKAERRRGSRRALPVPAEAGADSEPKVAPERTRASRRVRLVQDGTRRSSSATEGRVRLVQ